MIDVSGFRDLGRNCGEKEINCVFSNRVDIGLGFIR